MKKLHKLDRDTKLNIAGAMTMVEILFKTSIILYMVYSIGLHDMGGISDMNIAARMLLLSVLLFIL